MIVTAGKATVPEGQGFVGHCKDLALRERREVMSSAGWDRGVAGRQAEAQHHLGKGGSRGGAEKQWYNIKGEPKGFANVGMSGATPRFLPFTEVGKMAVGAREHGHLKFGFGRFKLQTSFKYKSKSVQASRDHGSCRG